LAYQSFAKEPAEAFQREARGGPAQDVIAVKEPEGVTKELDKAKIGNKSEIRRELTKGEYESIALIKLMEEPLDMKDFQNPMTLKEALGLLSHKFAAKGKELPVLIDVA